ncbi:MAG: polysaccharide pyruvyl transferase family protein [Bacteroidales bacterium]|nr:polysaccharide pyruvyl transferase family protein [Bacteroidales bacterium]
MKKNEYKTRVLLSAYTQLNLGDDLLIKSIVEKYPNTLFVVPCRKGYGTFLSLYKNVIPVNLNSWLLSYIDRFLRKYEVSSFYALNSLLLRILDIKYRFTHYIVIGGSIFMESSSKDRGYDVYRSYVRVKRILKNAKLDFIGCNFGPCISDQYKQNISKVFSLADDVCFRDRTSYETFHKTANIRLGNDVVLESLMVPKVEKKNKIGISLISLKERPDLTSLTEPYRKKISEIIAYFIDKQYEVVLFSFCEHLGDLEEAEAIRSSLNNNQNVSIYRYKGNMDEALQCFGQMEYVVASRFHAIILGMLFKSYVFPIAYSNKAKEMLNDYGLWKERYDIRHFVGLEIQEVLSSFVGYYEVETRESQFKKLDSQLS